MTSSSAEDQHAPSTGQPGVLTQAQIIHDFGLEIERLRQQLAAAQVERDNLGQHLRTEWNVIDQLRAQVVELRQRASDYEAAEGTAIAQRNAALNEALAYKYQAEAARKGLVRVENLLDDSSPFTTAGFARRAARETLAALDAASAGQPATPSNWPHPAPSVNDSSTQARPKVRNVGVSESRAGRHPEAPGE